MCSYTVIQRYQSDLYDYFKNQTQIEELDVFDIVVQLIQAVQLLHEAGYVHNDIKLDNIMILGSKDQSIMKIVLLDFGLASTYVDKKGNHKP